MGKTLDELLAGLPAGRRRKIEARGAELIAEEMTLRDLRKAMGRTQAQLARTTGKPQATISRMEAQSDMLLSNLNQVVEAMGGRVRIMAELPDRAPVLLLGLGELATAAKVSSPQRQQAARAAAKVRFDGNRPQRKVAPEKAAGKGKRLPTHVEA